MKLLLIVEKFNSTIYIAVKGNSTLICKLLIIIFQYRIIYD